MTLNFAAQPLRLVILPGPVLPGPLAIPPPLSILHKPPHSALAAIPTTQTYTFLSASGPSPPLHTCGPGRWHMQFAAHSNFSSFEQENYLAHERLTQHAEGENRVSCPTTANKLLCAVRQAVECNRKQPYCCYQGVAATSICFKPKDWNQSYKNKKAKGFQF